MSSNSIAMNVEDSKRFDLLSNYLESVVDVLKIIERYQQIDGFSEELVIRMRANNSFVCMTI